MVPSAAMRVYSAHSQPAPVAAPRSLSGKSLLTRAARAALSSSDGVGSPVGECELRRCGLKGEPLARLRIALRRSAFSLALRAVGRSGRGRAVREVKVKGPRG